MGRLRVQFPGFPDKFSEVCFAAHSFEQADKTAFFNFLCIHNIVGKFHSIILSDAALAEKTGYMQQEYSET